MNLHRQFGTMLVAGALVMSAACSQDLDVQNKEAPDVPRALASPSDVEALASATIQNWFTTQEDLDPWTMLTVTADLGTANFGNFGMRFNNLEPRIPYANDPANADIEVANNPWSEDYNEIGQSNSVLKVLATGFKLPDASGTLSDAATDQYKTVAMWTRAGSYAELGMLYDHAYIVDETTDLSSPTPPPLSPWPDVVKYAQGQFDAVIAALNGKTWSLASTQLPLIGVDSVSASVLARIANTQAALLLAYAPRNPSQVSSVDWAAVLNYAKKGIGQDGGTPFDLTIQGDGGNLWYSNFITYGDRPTWEDVDQRLINRMDPCVPDHYNGAAIPPDCAASATFPEGHDHRVQSDSSAQSTKTGVGLPHTSGADFVFAGSFASGAKKGTPIVQGDPTRGIYMQSPYIYERYLNSTLDVGNIAYNNPIPYILAAESDLIEAEALVQTGGDLVHAAALINNTRVTRGHLTPATAADGKAALLADITYEIEVECYGTNGYGFFVARGAGQLQPGTVHQLPIPATDLETLQLPVYTFGGPTDDYSADSPSANLMPASSGLKTLTRGRSADISLPNGTIGKLRLTTHNTRRTIGQR